MIVIRIDRLIAKILLFTLIANTFLGYPYSNLLINELLLIVSNILIIKKIPFYVKKYPIVIPLIIWSFVNIFRALIDFFDYGIWALRDAMHPLEVFWVFPTFYILEKIGIEKFLLTFFKISIYIIIVKIFIIFKKDLFSLIIIPGIQGSIPLFTSLSSFGFILIPTLVYGIHFSKSYTLKLFYLSILIVAVAILQSRNLYIFILIWIIVEFFSQNVKNKLKLIITFLLSIFILSVLSQISFLGKVSRFGNETIKPQYIIYHLSTVTGKVNNEKFEGPANGVVQRLRWWSNTINKLTETNYNLFFGLGFGIPLTDFYVTGGRIVREPHNSFISIVGRTGILGFLLWFISFSFILLRAYKKIFIIKFKYRKVSIIYPILIFFIYLFLLALSEPPFELPFEATIIYIYWAMIYFYIRRYT